MFVTLLCVFVTLIRVFVTLGFVSMDSFREPGTNALVQALMGNDYNPYYYHSYWSFVWDDVQQRVKAQPNNFGFLYFMYMLMSTWVTSVEELHYHAKKGIALDHIKEKLEFLNKKLFDQLREQYISLEYRNLESTLRCLDCIYCNHVHCTGLHPTLLLIQLICSGSCWLVIHHSHSSFLVSRIFVLFERKYCFLVNLSKRKAYYVFQIEPGFWSHPKYHFFPHWEITRKINVESTLQATTIFEMYKQGIEIGSSDFGLCGWINLEQLRDLYLRFQLFDWTEREGANVLGVKSISPPWSLQKRVKGFTEYLHKTQGMLFSKEWDD